MKRLLQTSKHVFCALIFLMVVLLGPPFFSRLTGLYLQRQCQDIFSLQFERAYWQRGVFCLENLTGTSTCELDAGGYEVFCPRLDVHFEFSLWTGDTALSLVFYKPVVRVGDGAERLLQSWSEASYKSFQPHIAIHEGLFIYPGEHTTAFSLDFDCTAAPTGQLDIYFQDLHLPDGHLSVCLQKENSADLAFKDMHLAAVARAMQFFKLSPALISISDGLATGALHVDAGKGIFDCLQGDFTATNLHIVDIKQDIELKLPKVRIRCPPSKDAPLIVVEEESHLQIRGKQDPICIAFTGAEIFLNEDGSLFINCQTKLSQQDLSAKVDLSGYVTGPWHLATGQWSAGDMQASIYFDAMQLPLVLKNRQVDCKDAHAYQFDLLLNYAGLEFGRLKGEAVQQGKGRKFYFQQDSCHLFGQAPNSLELALNEALHVEAFALTWPFDVAKIKEPLDYFMKALNCQIPLDAVHAGNFELALSGNQAHVAYQLSGSACKFGSQSFETCLVKGQKVGPLWTIEQGNLDDMSLTAELSYLANICLVHSACLKVSNEMQANIEGVYQIDEQLFQADVHIEADLQRFKGFGSLPGNSHLLAGQLKSAGQFSMQLGNGQAETFLTSTIDSPYVLGLACKQIGPFDLHWQSGKRLSLKSMHICLEQEDSAGTDQQQTSFEKIEWHLQTKQFYIDALHFAIQPKQLATLVTKLQSYFPSDAAAAISFLSAQKPVAIKGRVDLKESLQGPKLRLELAKNCCAWQEAEYQLDNFALEHLPCGWQVIFSTFYQGLPFWCLLHANAHMSQGQLFLSEHFPKHACLLRDPEMLQIDWQKTPCGFVVEKVEGRFAGLDVCCCAHTLSKHSALSLVGKVTVDLARLQKWLTAEMQENILSCGIKGLYTLDGRWQISKEPVKAFENRLSFHGQMQGQQVECKGYGFNFIAAQIDQDLTSTLITKGYIEDRAGLLHVDRLLLVRSLAGTKLVANKLVIRNLRPSLISFANALPPAETPFVMQVDLHNLQGYLHDLNSLTATGKFSFANHFKKSFLDALFVIPSEILHRIGLNLAILTPASGTLFFNMQAAKLIITQLKDVYSRGQFSKFYLDTHPFQSYIDFKGNLDLQVRMRQYNLLFKLAELFTIHISGSLGQPTYSLK